MYKYCCSSTYQEGEEGWYFLVVKERQRIKAISEVYREVLLEFVEKLARL